MEFELWQIIFAAVIVIAAIGMGVFAIRSAMCKGPLISQAWTLATPEQREKIDKKAEYQGVAVVFGGLAEAFLIVAGYTLIEKQRIFWGALIVAVIAFYFGMMGGLKRLRKDK